MSDITVSIPSDPIRTLVKSVLKDELQPTLYGNDNTLVGVIHEEIEASPRVQEHLKSVVIDTVLNSSKVEEFINDSLSTAADNSRSFRRAVESAVNDCIDYSELASSIDCCDIASHISYSDIADELDKSEIAREIDKDSLAEAVIEDLDYRALARAILREIRAEAAQAKPIA